MAHVETEPAGDQRPVPAPDDTTRGYWDAAAARRFVVQRCGSCGQLQYPPEVCCLQCRSGDVEYVEASGGGTIYSYAVVERPFHLGFLDATPYVVVLVELDEKPGLLLATNLLGVTPETPLACGMRVEVAFEERGPVTLPQFRLVEGA